jgi:hypothetical protein
LPRICRLNSVSPVNASNAAPLDFVGTKLDGTSLGQPQNNDTRNVN